MEKRMTMDFWIPVSDAHALAPIAVQLSQVSSVQFEGSGSDTKATLRLATGDNLHGEPGVNIFTVKGSAATQLREHIGQNLLGDDKVI